MIYKFVCKRCSPRNNEYFTVGKIYDVVDGMVFDDTGFRFRIWSSAGDESLKSLNLWFNGGGVEFELLKEDGKEMKKFTKKDIETGMFGITSRNEKFVIVNDLIVYEKGVYDVVTLLSDDMKFKSGKTIDKLFTGVNSFNMLHNVTYNPISYLEYGFKCVYDRSRDTVKEMTIAEIEKELGYSIKVVK